MSEDVFSTKPKEGEPWNVIIIGSGPSGLTAAIYTTRGAASTLILAGDKWGGQLMLTTEVDNYPGFPEGILGPELMEKMKAQATRFGAEMVMKNATSLKVLNGLYEVSDGEKVYKGKSVIIATGSDTRWLGVPGEDKLRGRGVSSCAPCDAPFFKNKKVAVVGGGDSAMEEALVLTKYAESVTVIHRRDKFRASQAMQQRVLNNKKIKVMWNTEVVELIGDQKLEKVKLMTKEGEVEEAFDGLFVAIGHVPMTGIFKDIIEFDEKGYVVRNSKSKTQNPKLLKFQMSTSREGIFVAGDVHDYHYKQAATAAGFGCMAGMEALKFLDKDAPNY